jgi:hypothetical protein
MRINKAIQRMMQGALTALVLLLPLSCTDFFTTSLAKGFPKRDLSKQIPDPTAENAKALAEAAENDPGLSLALLEKIAASKTPVTDPELKEAALEAAINAAGLFPALVKALPDLDLNNLDTLADTFTDMEDGDLEKILTKALDAMTNLDAISAALLGGEDNDGLFSSEDPEYYENIDSDNLAMGAVVLIAAKAKELLADPKGGYSTFDDVVKEMADEFGSWDGDLTNKAGMPDIVADLLPVMAMAKAAANNPNSGFLGELFGSLIPNLESK